VTANVVPSDDEVRVSQLPIAAVKSFVM